MNRSSKARIKGRDPTEPDSLLEELTDIEEMHRVDDKAICIGRGVENFKITGWIKKYYVLKKI